MKRCPITYEPIPDAKRYSDKGLKLLSRQLTDLNVFPLTNQEIRRQSRQRAPKMSIQGVQPKVSALLKIKEQSFNIVDRNGTYIIKPQNSDFEQLPENEALTMSMAKLAGFEVPTHGLLYCSDGSFAYFIKRFDRIRKKDKLAVEDFSQLAGMNRFTKYDASMEKVAKVIGQYCTYPMVENTKHFERVLFDYLTGNEDMHLKNFSLISRNNKVELAPVYDLVNSTIVLANVSEELALPLKGKKSRLKKSDFVDYYAKDRLKLNTKTIDTILTKLSNTFEGWLNLIDISFISDDMKEAYKNVLLARRKILAL